MESVQEAVASTSVSTHQGSGELAVQSTEAFESWEMLMQTSSLGPGAGFIFNPLDH